MNQQDQPEAISDLELMRYVDDELSEDELAALEELLERQEASQAKLAGLTLVGDLLRESANEDVRGDGIADAVMAKLELAADDGDLDDLDDLSQRDELPARDEVPAPIPIERTRPKAGAAGVPPNGAAANDNARTLWSLATVAAAVAAGLFVWGVTGTDEVPMPNASKSVTAPVETMEPAPETLGEVADAAPQLAREQDEDAVEIAQLDFGAHSGSIFKVDNENSGVHTAVVWVTDLGEDE